MSQSLFPLSTFQDASGKPLSNGFILVNITEDAHIFTFTGGQVCAGRTIRVPLDTNGVIIGSPLFWANDSLTPSGTQYIVRSYTSIGQLVGHFVLSIASSSGLGFGQALGSQFGS